MGRAVAEIVKAYPTGIEPTPAEDFDRISIALPLVPYDSLPTGETSDHHTMHPRVSEELIGTDNGAVIRSSRMQIVQGPAGSVREGKIPNEYHQAHQRYHYFFSGPDRKPRTVDEQFEFSIWMASLYVPRYGLDVSGNKPKKRRLTPKQINRLHDGELRVGCPGAMKVFLRNYVMEHGIPHLEGLTIEEFVESKDLDRKQELGRGILAAASEVVTIPFEKDFRKAHRLGRIKPTLDAAVAKVVQITVNEGNQEKLVKQLEHALRAA
jgi:hypothetical protein